MDTHEELRRQLYAELAVLSDQECQRLAGLSPATWARMDQRGELPPRVMISVRRIGRRASDFRKWLEARTEGRAA